MTRRKHIRMRKRANARRRQREWIAMYRQNTMVTWELDGVE